jgi:hypothetical protein
MATYVNDLRLKEIATGDESGTWGTSTNTNLELIAEAFSFGTEAITTNADTHTTTIADGSTDPGRSIYLKYTGTLDSACTITIGPNTVSKLWFIENGTSGSQNIIISQGSGANVTIPAGDTKAVYSDGAGSGAAIVDAFASLNVVDLKVEDDLTITDNLTFSSDSAVITFGADGDTTLTHTDGTGLTLNSTNKLCFNDASQFIQGSSATVLSLGATDEIDLTATAIDVNGTLDVSGAITSSAGATITTADNTNQLTLVSTDADAAVGPVLDLYRNSGSPADDDFLGKINFRGRNDNSQDVDYGYLSYFIADASDGTEDAFMQLGIMKGGSNTLLLEAGATETVFNQSSVDQDFRVESDNFTHALFLQGSDGGIGVNADTPAKLGVTGTGGLIHLGGTNTQVRLANSILHHNNSGNTILHLRNNYGATSNLAQTKIESGFTTFHTGTSFTERLRILAGGGLTFNGDTAAANALDDYEEGTFTPTFSSSNSTATGLYQKVGNTVTVFVHVVSTGGLPTSTAQVQIGNLPFTSASNHVSAGPLYIGPSNVSSAVGGGGQISTIMLSSETVIRLVVVDNTTLGYLIWGELEVSSNNVVTAFATHTYTV